MPTFHKSIPTLFSALAFAAVLTVSAPAADAAGACKNVNPGLVWTIQPTYIDNTTPTAIYSDGANGSNPSYVDGVDGVEAVINVCSSTDDATLNLSSSTRLIGLNLSAKLASTATSPSWTVIPGTQLFLNVRNILYLPPGKTAADSFTFHDSHGFQLYRTGQDLLQHPHAEPDVASRYDRSGPAAEQSV